MRKTSEYVPTYLVCEPNVVQLRMNSDESLNSKFDLANYYVPVYKSTAEWLASRRQVLHSATGWLCSLVVVDQ